MADEYLKLVKASRKKLSRIRFITEIEVLKAYKEATKSIASKIKENERRNLQTAYYENIYADLDDMVTTLNERLIQAIESGIYATVEATTGVQTLFNELIYPPHISTIANGYLRDLNYKYVNNFLAGGLYDDGKSLSDRIWEKSKKNCDDIKTLISSNIAKGANSRELAKKLDNYVNPTQMTKASTIVSGMDRNISYQAQRLARTSLTHIANETDRNNAKENVFCKGMRWNLSGSHYERQVKRWGEDICDVYANQDGYNLGRGVFPIEEYPISHPNCLCYATQEQPSLDDIINRVNNWVDGGEDEELENSYQKWSLYKDAINESEKSVKIDSKYSNKVDLGYINSKEYKEKFSKISNNETLNNEIYKRTKTILNHRNNTDKEDLCILNAKTGQLVALKSNNKKDLEVHYDKKLLELIKNSPRGTFISIHNHPNNLLPTGSDFVSCGSKGYAFGIVVGHDGSVYKYKHGDKAFRKEFLDSKVEKIRKMSYNSTYKEAQIKVLRDFEKSHNISLKEL